MEAAVTPLRVFETAESLGEAVAAHVLSRVAEAEGRFLLGCPTGRTPRPVYAALARRNADLGKVTLVMMDEYLVASPSDHPWSCHTFVRQQMSFGAGEIWFPDPADPASYDQRIADAGGIDLFLLASGASDGHVAFNSTGSPRDSRTRIVPLSAETRRDNLQTSPSFGSLENVPHQGVSVGIATIAEAREAIMLLTGASKRVTLQRILAASAYDPAWPATVIHECAVREIVADAAAADTRA